MALTFLSLALTLSATSPVLATAADKAIVVTTTIQAAVDAASPGDTIVVPPGIYHETVTVTRSGLTIRGLVTPCSTRPLHGWYPSVLWLIMRLARMGSRSVRPSCSTTSPSMG